MAQTPSKNIPGSGEDSSSAPVMINGQVPTPSDMRLVFSIVASFNSKPDFDWEKIAAATGYTRKSALERWRMFRIKYAINIPDTPAAGATPGRRGRKAAVAATPATATPATPDGGAADPDATEEEQVAAPTPTPMKRGRGRPRKNSVATPAKNATATAIAYALSPAAASLPATPEFADNPAKKRGPAEVGSDGETGADKEQPAKKKQDMGEGEEGRTADASTSELSPVPSQIEA